jgi:hypothetical protein
LEKQARLENKGRAIPLAAAGRVEKERAALRLM